MTTVRCEGYVYCKSKFYTAHDSISATSEYTFNTGVNKLHGEIDSGNWAVSYLLSMYDSCSEDFVLLDNPEINVDGKSYSVSEIQKYSCYMDEQYPLFSSDASVKEQVIQGIKSGDLCCSENDIKELFQIDDERFERPLHGVGNEVYKAMAAIAYSYGKEIYCFPWLSAKRFDGYHANMTNLLDILEKLQKTVIVPIGNK